MWREMDGREPCPRCGKMLKPLSPAAKARYLKLDSLMEPEARERLADIYGAAGTVRHICKPGPAEREAAALRDELERVEALAEGRETAAPPPPPLAPTPEEDAGAAAEDVIQRAASPAGRRHVEALRQALAEEGAAVHLDPPPPRRRLAVMPPLFLPPSWGRPWTPS